MVIKKNGKSKKKVLMKDKFKENPWILSTIVFGIIAVIFILGSLAGGGSNVGENFVNFINSQGDTQIELVGSENFGSGLYEVIILSEGKEIPVHITEDGKYWVQIMSQLVEKEEVEKSEITGGVVQSESVEDSSYSSEDLEKLEEFSSCLAKEGIKIYGANWCGWTKKLVVETLGGFAVVGDAYVECTEEDALCRSEGVTGYPTIKLNGEDYAGARTLGSLGDATGCSVPELTGSVTGSSSEVQC